MNLLAFDTCFSTCAAAAGAGIGAPSARIAARAERMAQGHAERLLPMIEEVLAEAGLRPKDLDRIVVANGPGTFTGTRIAVSAARAFALALGTPIVAMSSLEMLAHHPALGGLDEDTEILITNEATRSQVYCQRFGGPGRLPLTAPSLVAATELRACAGSAPLVVAGTAALFASATLGDAGVPVRAAHPGLVTDAAGCLAAAALRTPLAEPLAPLYLRPPDARPQDGTSLPRAP